MSLSLERREVLLCLEGPADEVEDRGDEALSRHHFLMYVGLWPLLFCVMIHKHGCMLSFLSLSRPVSLRSEI